MFTAFNRPDLLQETLAPFASRAGDSCLFLHLDGPRLDHPEDIKLIENNLEIFVDFCSKNNPIHYEVRSQPTNLGCMRGMQSAISWFFSKVESGLIIEDDILVHPDVISEVDLMLEKFNDDKSVGSISLYAARNFFPRSLIIWRRSTWPHIWAWATWRDRWEAYDYVLEKNFSLRNWVRLVRHFGYRRAQTAQRLFSKHADHKDTWDTQWLYTHFKNRWTSISPSRALSSNLGFDERATHTKVLDKKINCMDSIHWTHRHIFVSFQKLQKSISEQESM